MSDVKFIITNEFLTAIGSPFRIGGEYQTRSGKAVIAQSVKSGPHPRVVFSDGWDRNAKNGRVNSRSKNVHDIDLIQP